MNGVRQEEGSDFVRDGGELVFDRKLATEGKLGFWRWTSLFLGIAGTYRQNDSVDVVYDVGGRRHAATGLKPKPVDDFSPVTSRRWKTANATARGTAVKIAQTQKLRTIGPQ